MASRARPRPPGCCSRSSLLSATALSPPFVAVIEIAVPVGCSIVLLMISWLVPPLAQCQRVALW